MIRMIAIFIQILSTFGALLMIWIITDFLRNYHRFRRFKGPLALPIVGNCYVPQALMFMKYMISLRKRYGPIFRFFALTKPYLIICDPILARRILTDSKLFVKGEMYTKYFSLVFGEGLVTSNGDKHRVDRAMFAKYFQKCNLLKHVNRMNTITIDGMKTLLGNCVSSNEHNPNDGDNHTTTNDNTAFATGTYNLEKFFAILTLRVFSNFAYSDSFKLSDESTLCHNISRGSYLVGSAIVFGLPISNIFPQIRELRYLKSTEWRYLEPMYERRKAAIIASQLKKSEKNKVEMKGGTLSSSVSSTVAAAVPEENAAVDDNKDEDNQVDDVPDDLLSMMIAADMSIKDICDHFSTLTSAGHDTTAYFAAYLCYLLATHTDIQDKVRNEIFTIYNIHHPSSTATATASTATTSTATATPKTTTTATDSDHTMNNKEDEKSGDAWLLNHHHTADDLFELKYLQQVMMETLRLYAIVPIVSKTAAEDVHLDRSSNITTTTTTTTTIASTTSTNIAVTVTAATNDTDNQSNDIFIEKDTNILIPLFIMNRDPSIWGDDAGLFNPDRWADDHCHSSQSHSSQSHRADFVSPKQGYFPFGYGSRSCIGSLLAQIECSVFVCHLLRRYRLSVPAASGGFKPVIRAGISLTTSNGIHVTLSPI